MSSSRVQAFLFNIILYVEMISSVLYDIDFGKEYLL